VSDIEKTLRNVRDALAPYDTFKEWCADRGVNYKAAGLFRRTCGAGVA
jgi:hypothetical protein